MTLKISLPKIKFRNIYFPASLLIYVSLISLFIIGFVNYKNTSTTLNAQIKSLNNNEISLKTKLQLTQKQLDDLKKEDQYLINKNLEAEIKNIQDTYKKSVTVYESLLDLKAVNSKTDKKMDEQFAEVLKILSERNYTTAGAKLNDLAGKIKTEQDKIASSFVIPASVPVVNTPPTSGYNRQTVATEVGSFLVNIISADLSSTRVIVDTASESSCGNDCPVLSLGDYVSRNGAYAGINGSYFCPATYPQCADKKNSFDTLLMNKNKTYFNSDNNVYSTVPAVIFGGGWVRFVGRSLEWGRDTGIDSMIANQPLLVSGGNIVFGGDGDPKKGSKGPRSFVANKGNTIYIGVTSNATVAENAYVMKTLGMDNALNLDSGGSTALWYQGYKAGPGRNIPNAILFVRK